MVYELIEIAKKFQIKKGEITYLEKYGEGHINETYLVVVGNTKKYILQKINNSIFPDVKGLMNNIKLVTEFQREELIKNGGDPTRETMTLIPTVNNENFQEFQGKYYRMYDFVENSVSLQIVTNSEDFRQSAIGFGSFANLLAKFDASKLVEVIPNFHNTQIRYEHFLESVKKDVVGRKNGVENEIKFVTDRENYYSKIVDLIAAKNIPVKVTHNDTKLNNILLDEKTMKALCVIDLDTIMPGTILYDFGDSIRFGCNTASEDEKDLSKVNFSLEYFEAYVDGYLSQVKDSITKYELENLAFGAILMTIECGIRFLDDYLSGDTYFRTKYPEHNLVRCHTQFKLVEEMEKHFEQMNQIVNDSYKKYQK